MSTAILITEDSFDKLDQRIERMEKLLKLASLYMRVPTVVKVKDVAALENVSISQIMSKEAYLLPRFGESAYATGSIRWPREEYFKWSERPVEDRIKEFQLYKKNKALKLLKEQKSGILQG